MPFRLQLVAVSFMLPFCASCTTAVRRPQGSRSVAMAVNSTGGRPPSPEQIIGSTRQSSLTPPAPKMDVVAPALPARARVPEATKPLPPVPIRPSSLPSPKFDLDAVDGLLELFGGTEVLAEVVTADHIDVVRLHPRKKGSRAPKDYDEEFIRTLNSEETALVRSVLTSDNTYEWAEQFECDPDYGIEAKMRRGERIISIDLCFGCTTLRVLSGTTEHAIRFDFGAAILRNTLRPYFSELREETASREAWLHLPKKK